MIFCGCVTDSRLVELPCALERDSLGDDGRERLVRGHNPDDRRSTTRDRARHALTDHTPLSKIDPPPTAQLNGTRDMDTLEGITVYGNAMVGQAFRQAGAAVPQGITEDVFADPRNGTEESLKRLPGNSIKPTRIIPEARERAFIEAGKECHVGHGKVGTLSDDTGEWQWANCCHVVVPMEEYAAQRRR